MKTYAAGAACLLAACLAAACGDDDDDGGVSGGGGGTSGVKVADVMPPVANAGIKFPVTAIYYGGDYYDYYSLSYENGRMTSFTEGGDGYNLPFTFSENPLTVSYYEGSSDNYSVRGECKNIRVNGMGFVTSCDLYEEINDYGSPDVATVNITVEYDGEGHKVRETCRGKDVYYAVINEYTWQDGNLIHVSSKEYEGEWVNEWKTTYEYEEGRYPNPGVWSFFRAVEDEIVDDDHFSLYASYGGLLGKPTKNIPVKCVVEYTGANGDGSMTGSETDIYTLTGVGYNEDGSVDSISSNHRGDGHYGDCIVRFAYGDASGRSYEPAAGFSPVRIGVADGSRRGRRGLHERLMERIAQGKNAR